MSNTLMIAESVRTGFDPATPKSNWASLDANRMLVTITTDICGDQTCISGNVNLKMANSGRHAINAGVLLAEGTAPWPNSFHHLGVNAAFADGHVSFISQQIDGEILFNLFTPQGERLRGTPLESSHLTTSF
jgi:prepilin-type processing-associated H-X9-DG protein